MADSSGVGDVSGGGAVSQWCEEFFQGRIWGERKHGR